MEGCGNGVFGNERYFICPDGKAYFCRICDLQSLDSLCSPTPPATGGAPPPTVPVSTGGGGTSYTNREYDMLGGRRCHYLCSSL